jgi:surface polysaccharide O-acyltransferase-like enzyme
MTIYYLWEPYQRGYLIQPWFVFAFIVIYTFHPLSSGSASAKAF